MIRKDAVNISSGALGQYFKVSLLSGLQSSLVLKQHGLHVSAFIIQCNKMFLDWAGEEEELKWPHCCEAGLRSLVVRVKRWKWEQFSLPFDRISLAQAQMHFFSSLQDTSSALMHLYIDGVQLCVHMQIEYVYSGYNLRHWHSVT